MTTNVYDSKAGMLASDSRISSQEDGYTFFVDDIGYEKIVYDPYVAILFAGEIDKVDPWKSWFLGGRNGDPPEETDEDLSMCIIDLATGTVDLDRGEKVASPCNLARFAGTGGQYAKRYWVRVKEDALGSVEAAYSSDRRSGGIVKYVDRKNKKSNLEEKVSMDRIIDVMAEQGGVIMPNFTTRTILSIKEAIKTSNEVKEAFDKVKNGGAASLCMPFAGMGKPWTKEERNKLYTSLKKYPPIPRK